MRDKDKTKEQLVSELVAMRQRVAELETSDSDTKESLRQCTAELKARYEELHIFARTLSHDLRGTLGLIISFAQVLEEYHAALTGEELGRYLDTIAQRGHRMINVIDELLGDQAGLPSEGEIEMGPLNMDSIVAQALDILEYMIEERAAHIILPESWPAVLGYAPWVEEVWVNYLSNAIQYGGRPPRVELGATEQADGSVRFWVRDNGDGLSAEKRAQLFKPAVQPDPLAHPATGYGLGLVIVRRIMEKLGGQIGVESEGLPGRGSLFFFTLPPAEQVVPHE